MPPPFALSINTSAQVDYRTSLTQAQIDEIKGMIAGINRQADNMTQYQEIKEILTKIGEAEFTKSADQMAMDALRENIDKMLEGKQGSKPHEYISLLEATFDRVKPKNAKGGKRKTRKQKRKTKKSLKRK